MSIFLKLAVEVLLAVVQFGFFISAIKRITLRNAGSKKELKQLQYKYTDNLLVKELKEQRKYINKKLGLLYKFLVGLLFFDIIAFIVVVAIWSLMPLKIYAVIAFIVACGILGVPFLRIFVVKKQNEIRKNYCKTHPDNPLRLHVYPDAVINAFTRDNKAITTYLFIVWALALIVVLMY